MDSLSCPLCCGANFGTCKELRQHLAAFVYGVLKCPLCTSHVIGIKKLLRHLETHDGHQALTPKHDKLNGLIKTREKVNEKDVCLKIISCGSLRNGQKVTELQSENVSALTEETNNKSKKYPIHKTDQKETKPWAKTNTGISKPTQGYNFTGYQWLGETFEERHPYQETNVQILKQPEKAKGEITLTTVQSLSDSPQKGIKTIHCSRAVVNNSVHWNPGITSVESASLKKTESVGAVSCLQVRDLSILPHDCESASVQYLCAVCDVSLQSMLELKNHAATAHAKQGCVIQMKSEDNTNHLGEGNAEIKVPQVLSDGLVNSGRLLPRLKPGRKPKKKDCDTCGRKFQRTNDLRIHSYIHKDRSEWPFECHLCGRHFTKKTAMNIHLQRKHSDVKSSGVIEEKVECSVCKRLVGKSYLQNHMKFIHENERPFKCDTCDARFYSLTNKYSHMVCHVGSEAKPFACNICPKRFRDSFSLKVHLRKHTGEKPYQCSYCSQRFTIMYQCKIHERIHTGEKPYKCRYCERAFRLKHMLNVHSRLHSQEKCYKCNICEAQFSTHFKVHQHFRIHAESEQYKCNHCCVSYKNTKCISSNEKSILKSVQKDCKNS